MDKQKDGVGSWQPVARKGLRGMAAGAVLALACSAAGAQDMREQARNAAVADGVSTAIGLAAGAMEVNPLGPIVSLGLKTLAFRYAESRPEIERPAVYAVASSLWQGAAANNVCVTAALLTGGSFAPVCIALGAAWAYKAWKDTEHERQFWEACAVVRVYVEQPDLQCIYKAPGTAVAAAPMEHIEIIVSAEDVRDE